jgi:hypothetical protein
MSAICVPFARRFFLASVLCTGAGASLLFSTLSHWSEFVSVTQFQRDGASADPDQLEALRVDVLRRIAEKDRVAAAVVARRLTLAQAVDRFRALNDPCAPSRARESALWHRPRMSEKERLCRQVIAWVRVSLENAPAQARAVGAQLEKEMRELLGH